MVLDPLFQHMLKYGLSRARKKLWKKEGGGERHPGRLERGSAAVCAQRCWTPAPAVDWAAALAGGT